MNTRTRLAALALVATVLTVGGANSASARSLNPGPVHLAQSNPGQVRCWDGWDHCRHGYLNHGPWKP